MDLKSLRVELMVTINSLAWWLQASVSGVSDYLAFICLPFAKTIFAIQFIQPMRDFSIPQIKHTPMAINSAAAETA